MLTLATTLFLAAWGGASDTQVKAQNAVGQRVIYEMNVGSFTTEGTTWTIPAYGYQWDTDGATAIHTPLATTFDHACYTLAGVKVAEPLSKGIYIRDGRKFLMR